MSTQKKAQPGSVSEATMQPRDLIPRFMAELETLDHERAKAIQEEYQSIFDALDNGTFDERYDSGLSDMWFERPTADHTFVNDAEWLLNDVLFDVLNEYAPKNHYFGAHPGDGADYGFWRYDEDEDEDEDENPNLGEFLPGCQKCNYTGSLWIETPEYTGEDWCNCPLGQHVSEQHYKEVEEEIKAAQECEQQFDETDYQETYGSSCEW